MNKLFLLLTLSLTNLTWAQEIIPVTEANFAEQVYEAPIPVMMGSQRIGEIRARLKGETLESIEQKTLLIVLKAQVQKSVWSEVEKKSGWLNPQDLNFKLKYDPQNAVLVLDVPTELSRFKKLEVGEDFDAFYGDEARKPAPLGGAINYRVEKSWGSDLLGGEAFSSYFESFVNIGGVVLEGQMNYTDDAQGQGWFRGDTRLVKDFQKNRVRAEAGDVYPSSFGFMPARPIGGVHVARNFTLDPYQVPFPQGQGQFTLRTRSQVRTFVNGILIRDEWLPAGNYDLRDVPLINGLNTVLVETTDELGEKRIYDFRLPTSVGLLRHKEWNFSLSHGRPFQDMTFRRTYTDDEITSGYLQYGVTRAFSAGSYAQRQDDFSLGGIELGLATNFGNLFLGGAQSRDNDVSAGAGSLTWQLQSLGSRLFSSYTLTLRHERFEKGFTSVNDGMQGNLAAQSAGNFTIPIQELMTLSLGASLGQVRDETLDDRRGWDATLNLRAWRNLNISFFMARNRDEFKRWNDVAYAFFTWTFDSASHFITGFHDAENNLNRLTAVRDNGNRLYSPRLTATAEEGPSRDGGEIDAFVPTPVADLGARVQAAKFENSGNTEARGIARMSQAIVFAYQDGDFGLGLSRPVPNSFVLFKPNDELKGQKVALRSTSPFTEGESGPLGEITFTNLLPYQYREIQLDPSGLEMGTSLVQEKFIVYPTYRSAHLIALEDKGSVILSGTLVDTKGRALGLRVGDIGGKPFFTSQEGQFYIEGLNPGNYQLNLEGFKTLDIKLDQRSRGLRQLGAVRVEEEE